MRRWKLLAVVGLAVLVGVGAFVLWPRPDQPDRITRANYERLRQGMSRAEVEAILGPPGDFRSGPTAKVHTETGTLRMLVIAEKIIEDSKTCQRQAWVTDKMEVYALYSQSGFALATLCYSLDRQEQGPLDNLLWRAKRQWRRWFPE
jgi:hypothetical protein